jgi:hypothetical protein
MDYLLDHKSLPLMGKVNECVVSLSLNVNVNRERVLMVISPLLSSTIGFYLLTAIPPSLLFIAISTLIGVVQLYLL